MKKEQMVSREWKYLLGLDLLGFIKVVVNFVPFLLPDMWRES